MTEMMCVDFAKFALVMFNEGKKCESESFNFSH